MARSIPTLLGREVMRVARFRRRRFGRRRRRRGRRRGRMSRGLYAKRVGNRL